jgi:large subunit ribosomal protein L29
MKPTEIRELTDDELLAREDQFKRAAFNLRVQFSTGQLENTAALRTTKRDLARVKTVIRERKLSRTGRSS